MEDFLRRGEYRVRFMSWILPSEGELVLLFFDPPKGEPGPLRVDEGQNLRRARLEAPQTSSRNDLCVLPIRRHEISSNSGIHLCLPLSPFTRVANSAKCVLGWRGGGDLRSDRVLGRDAGTIKMGTGGTIRYMYRCRARLEAPQTSSRNGLCVLPIRRPQLLFIYRKSGVDNPETFGQIACSVRRLPIRFTVGTGGTIRN